MSRGEVMVSTIPNKQQKTREAPVLLVHAHAHPSLPLTHPPLPPLPSLPQVSSNSATGEIIVSGMGELHLEVYVERIRREYKVGRVRGGLEGGRGGERGERVGGCKYQPKLNQTKGEGGGGVCGGGDLEGEVGWSRGWVAACLSCVRGPGCVTCARRW